MIRIKRDPEEPSISCSQIYMTRIPYNTINERSWRPTIEGVVNFRPDYGGRCKFETTSTEETINKLKYLMTQIKYY